MCLASLTPTSVGPQHEVYLAVGTAQGLRYMPTDCDGGLLMVGRLQATACCVAVDGCISSCAACAYRLRLGCQHEALILVIMFLRETCGNRPLWLLFVAWLPAAAFIRIYRVLDAGRRLELLHKTQVDAGTVGALAAYKVTVVCRQLDPRVMLSSALAG